MEYVLESEVATQWLTDYVLKGKDNVSGLKRQSDANTGRLTCRGDLGGDEPEEVARRLDCMQTICEIAGRFDDEEGTRDKWWDDNRTFEKHINKYIIEEGTNASMHNNSLLTGKGGNHCWGTETDNGETTCNDKYTYEEVRRDLPSSIDWVEGLCEQQGSDEYGGATDLT